jgi:hypothetical protein
MPSDFDSDEILDPCGNCVYTQNGPQVGSSMKGSVRGGSCQSDLECTGPGEVCDLSQLDDNGDRVENACPEPGTAMGLIVGTLVVAGYPRKRMSRVVRGSRKAWSTGASGASGASRAKA